MKKVLINALKVIIGLILVLIIIGGIGLATGVISQTIFGVTIVMTIVTTILAPIMLEKSYKNKV